MSTLSQFVGSAIEYVPCEILVVGGGGNSGELTTSATTQARCSGGGGSGGLYVSTHSIPKGVTITVEVGAGGGNFSAFGGIWVDGGGAGASLTGSQNAGQTGESRNNDIRFGGSGGGGSFYTTGGTGSSGSGGVSSSGLLSVFDSPIRYIYGATNGGVGQSGIGGGGGGAAIAGSGVSGGAGTSRAITGSSVTYAAGGNGGSSGAATGANGAANTGDGAKGSYIGAVAGTAPAFTGGSGVIIIAYPDIYPAATVTGSPTEPSRSGYRVYHFTGDGTFKI